MSWAETVAEALTYAPERLDAVAADALGAPWRAALGISEPSSRLEEALRLMCRIAVRDDAAGESDLETLVRLVLGLVADQRQTRSRQYDARGFSANGARPRHATWPPSSVSSAR
jgi:hypothetical protein